ncbi:MAG: SPOR domain-containing protein [Burkholderiales bacterium]|nr:SPOR domain-containing protein [Burkholderiales bacterium]
MTVAAPRRPTLGELAAADARLNGAAVASQPPLSVEAAGVFLQLGAFSSQENAEAFRQHVIRMLPWLEQPAALHPRDGLVRVQLGPYADPIEALAVAERIRDAVDWKPVIIVR